MTPPLPPSPDLPQWAYWLLLPIVLGLAAVWRFISADARKSMYQRKQRNKPTNYVKLYSKTRRNRK
jgi:hypothetical protein